MPRACSPFCPPNQSSRNSTLQKPAFLRRRRFFAQWSEASLSESDSALFRSMPPFFLISISKLHFWKTSAREVISSGFGLHVYLLELHFETSMLWNYHCFQNNGMLALCSKRNVFLVRCRGVASSTFAYSKKIAPAVFNVREKGLTTTHVASPFSLIMYI
jgi:hypothetical protein